MAELEVWLEAASQWQTITSHSNSSTPIISSVEIWYRSLEFCVTNMLDQGNHHPRDAFSRLVVYLEKDDISQDDLNEMLYRVATAKKYFTFSSRCCMQHTQRRLVEILIQAGADPNHTAMVQHIHGGRHQSQTPLECAEYAAIYHSDLYRRKDNAPDSDARCIVLSDTKFLSCKRMDVKNEAV